MIEPLLWLFLIAVIAVIVVEFITRKIGVPKVIGLQRDIDLRLTYKRYLEIYPSARITYAEYKRMQAERAYKKAVSSTKIKRMVR